MSGANETNYSRLLRQQTALAKFGELALKSDDLDEILTEACRLVGDALGTDLAKVMELQDNGRTLIARAGVGWKPGVVGVAIVEAGENTSEGHALRTGSPMISPDIETETRFKYAPFLIENGVRAVANVVILGGQDRPSFGILQIDSRQPHEFVEDDTLFLRSYANLIAAAVDRLRTYESMRDKEGRLRLALEAGELGSWDLDLNSGVITRTPRYDQIFGYQGESAAWTHETFLQHVLPEDRERVSARFRRATEAGAELHFECRICWGNDGETRWIEVRSRAVGARGNASVTHLLGVVADITERVRTEERVRQSQRIEAVGRLTAGIAHDFNNVLQSLVSGLELAIDEVEDRPEVEDELKLALQAGQRGVRLTSHLLSFSRQQILRPVALDLLPLLSDLSSTLERTLGRDIAILVDVPINLPSVLVDAAHLDSALLNLALNARDAMPRGGQLRIKTHIMGNQVVISVTDTGVGMTPDVLAHACEPFFSTRGVGGSGLGLSMVQGFARQSGGELRIQSAIDQGTHVEIWLPVAPSPAVVQTPPNAPPSRGQGMVLVVDDDAHVKRVVMTILRKAGFDVTSASNGAEALVALGRLRVDALVTDFAMPVMNGADLALKARELDPKLPILVITGYASIAGSEHLPVDVKILRKPFQREGLLSVVKSLVELGKTHSQPAT